MAFRPGIGSDWLEFFVCCRRDYYHSMADMGLYSRNPVLMPGLNDSLRRRCCTPYDAFGNNGRRRSFSVCRDSFWPYMPPIVPHASRSGMPAFAVWLNCFPEQMAVRCSRPHKRWGCPASRSASTSERRYGCPPGVFRLRQRLNDSRHYLLSTRNSVERIGVLCGFRTDSLFSRRSGYSSASLPVHSARIICDRLA